MLSPTAFAGHIDVVGKPLRHKSPAVIPPHSNNCRITTITQNHRRFGLSWPLPDGISLERRRCWPFSGHRRRRASKACGLSGHSTQNALNRSQNRAAADRWVDLCWNIHSHKHAHLMMLRMTTNEGYLFNAMLLMDCEDRTREFKTLVYVSECDVNRQVIIRKRKNYTQRYTARLCELWGSRERNVSDYGWDAMRCDHVNGRATNAVVQMPDIVAVIVAVAAAAAAVAVRFSLDVRCRAGRDVANIVVVAVVSAVVAVVCCRVPLQQLQGPVPTC